MKDEIQVGTSTAVSKIVEALNVVLGEIPSTGEKAAAQPLVRAAQIARLASVKAAGVSGAMALPPGPLGMLTVLPDLYAVWKIQSQMVIDIAGAFGKEATCTQEQMVYCLFKVGASQIVRDLVVRVGERILVKRLPKRVLQRLLQRVGVKITQRAIGKAASRYLGPLAALGVAGYAYYDTAAVAQTAIELFSQLDTEGTEAEAMSVAS